MIKFRYVYSNGKEIKSFILTIEEIEDTERIFESIPFEYDFKLISRDRFTGLKDKNDVEIFENDVAEFNSKKLLIEFRVTHSCFSAVEKKPHTLDLHYNFRKDMAENRLKIISNTHIEKLKSS